MTRSRLPPAPSLDRFVSQSPHALFLDFDGTLVNIAPTPDGIQVSAGLMNALRALAERLEGRLALVSGRSIADLERHLGPIDVAVAGSHGADRRHADGEQLGEAPQALSADLLKELGDFASDHGFGTEDKPHGAALHYRSDPSLEPKGLSFMQDLAAKSGLVIKRGKCVIELVTPDADKAGAVLAFMQTAPFAGSTPIFIGDDVTDEDGMRAARELGGFGIAVGERESENGQYALATPAAVQHWLQL